VDFGTKDRLGAWAPGRLGGWAAGRRPVQNRWCRWLAT
jgi:hypothetical protein